MIYVVLLNNTKNTNKTYLTRVINQLWESNSWRAISIMSNSIARLFIKESASKIIYARNIAGD